MSRATFEIALIISTVIATVIVTATVPASAFNDMCERDYAQCTGSCEGLPGKGTEGSRYEACIGRCGLMFVDCMNPKSTSGSSSLEPPGTTGTPPPKPVVQPPGIVGVEQPPGGVPPPKPVLPPPATVGVNKLPPGSGSGTTPTGPIGVHPVYPLPGKVNQPVTGTGSGETIYAKGGTVKPPVVTTSPNGLTTTTVYDANGNYTSTNTTTTGKILSKTTAILDQSGGYKSTTTDANGKILNTLVRTSDGKSTLYDSTNKIVSQGAKIMTSTTGKGHKEGFLGQGSQKHKENSMNELFHEEKHNVKQSSPTPPQGRHR